MTQNIHLDHIEDLIFDERGYSLYGYFSDIISFLSGGLKMFPGVSVSTKWDGAPSFVAGFDQQKHSWFVGTKSVFNKRKPIKCYSIHDIWCYYGHDEKYTTLVDKLISVFEILPKLNYRGIFQGDFLFYDPDYQYLEKTKKFRIQFQPNTLKYQMDLDNYVNLGFVPHTEYDQNLQIINKPLSEQFFKKQIPGVLIIDPRKESYSWFTPDLTEKYLKNIVRLEERFIGVKRTDFWKILQFNPKSKEDLKKHINSCIASGLDLYYPENGFEDPTLTVMDCQMYCFLDLYKDIQKIKNELITSLNFAAKNDVIIYSPSGEVTNHEGYVLLDFDGVRTKWIDRKEFSRMNMMNDKKGWTTK